METVAGRLTTYNDSTTDFTPTWLKIPAGSTTSSSSSTQKDFDYDDEQLTKSQQQIPPFSSRSRNSSASRHQQNDQQRVWSPKRHTFTSSDSHFYPDYCQTSQRLAQDSKGRHSSSSSNSSPTLASLPNGLNNLFSTKSNTNSDITPSPSNGKDTNGSKATPHYNHHHHHHLAPVSPPHSPSRHVPAGRGGSMRVGAHPPFQRHSSFPTSNVRPPHTAVAAAVDNTQEMNSTRRQLTPDDFPSLRTTPSANNPNPNSASSRSVWGVGGSSNKKQMTTLTSTSNPSSPSSSTCVNQGMFRATIRGTKVGHFPKQISHLNGLFASGMSDVDVFTPVFTTASTMQQNNVKKDEEVEPSEDEKRLLKSMGWQEDVLETPLTSEEKNSFNKTYLRQRGGGVRSSQYIGGSGSSWSQATSDDDDYDDEHLLRLEVEALTSATDLHQQQREAAKMEEVMNQYADIYLNTLDERRSGPTASGNTSTTVSDDDDEATK